MTNGDGGVDILRTDVQKPPRDITAVRRLADRFIELVRELPYVRQVRLDEACAEPCIWTLIEVAPPDDQQRDRVYDAELEASKGHPDILLDFRLVNLAEYPDAPAEYLVPTHADVLLQR